MLGALENCGTIRTSLIGCGRWGRNILRDLRTLGSEVAVADPNAESRRIAVRAGAHPVVSSLDELPDSNGIVIATPASTHATVVEQVLEREVPVFVEKPFTTSALVARTLAARAPDRIFVMDKWRYHPGIEELRRIGERFELGKPLGMHLLHVGWGNPHPDVDVVWVLLPHCLSIVLEVLGVLPEANQAFGEQVNGAYLTLAGVLGNEPWARVEVSSRSPVKRREFRLDCENGVAWLGDGWADHVKIARGNRGIGSDAEDVEVRSVMPELPLFRELRTFIEHLKGGLPPRSSAREGVLITERIAQMRDLASRRR